jgi:multiple sugar transport system substrate-binding protein
MKSVSRIFSLALLAVMLFSLFGCAPAAPQVVKEVVTQVVEVEKTVEVVKEVVKEVVVTSTPAPKAEGIKTIIRVGTGDSGEGLNPHQDIIAAFEKANPDIIVQLEAVAGSDYYARLLAQIAADDAPDIIQISDDAVPMFVSKGGFLPLDDFIKGKDSLDTSIYLPNTLTPGMYQGKQYFLPKDFSTMAVYYNKKVFDKYKVPYPKDGWTWDEFLKTAQTLTIDENKDGTPEVWGVQLMANWNGYEYFTASTGAKLISDDGKQIVGYMDSPETIKAVQFYVDMYNKYKVAPPPADFNQWAGGNKEFETGQAAMRLFGRWPQSGLLNNPNVDLGLVSVPVGDKKANIMFWGGFGIFSGSKNSEAAWKFLKFYVGKEGSETWIKHGIPPVASVVQAAGMDKDPIEGVWIAGLNDVVKRAYQSSDYWGETGANSMGKALEKLLIDPTADVATVMKDAAAEAQTALDEKLK